MDITDTFETKLAMFACHRSQHEEWGGDAFGVDFTTMVRNDDKMYASACGTLGCEAVEAFSLCTDWPIIAGAHKLLP